MKQYIIALAISFGVISNVNAASVLTIPFATTMGPILTTAGEAFKETQVLVQDAKTYLSTNTVSPSLRSAYEHYVESVGSIENSLNFDEFSEELSQLK